jgi:hypothetical protein
MWPSLDLAVPFIYPTATPWTIKTTGRLDYEVDAGGFCQDAIASGDIPVSRAPALARRNLRTTPNEIQ